MTTDEAVAKILEEETEAQRRIDEQKYRGHRIGDLRRVFDRVADPEDWRGPIRCWIPHDLFKAAAAAVEFFTCTELKVVAGPQALTGCILVEADGYRNGPAGP